jgi:hypothetical protein
MRPKLNCPLRNSSPSEGPAILGYAKDVSRSSKAVALRLVLLAPLFLLLLLAPNPIRANLGAVRVPFRMVKSMILIEGKIDQKRVTFLLDTGSNHTIVDVRSGGLPFLLHPGQRNGSAAGMTGESVRLPRNLTLADHTWTGQCVTMMNLADLEQVLGIPFDGLLGQDILGEFRSVRIDYKAHVLELLHWQGASSCERNEVSTHFFEIREELTMITAQAGLRAADPRAYRENLFKLLGDRDPLESMAETASTLGEIVRNYPVAFLRTRPLEGKWTPLEVLGHLTDSEWVYGYRLRLILSEDYPPILGTNQDLWVARQRHNEREPSELLEMFRAMRQFNLALWKGMSLADLERVGQHNERGPESLGRMLRMMAGHDLSHLEQINRYLQASTR